MGTALKKDAVGLILARVAYLLEHPDHLPEHNALSANGECAAMWCVTGRWCTLQGASILQITSVGQAGGALLAGQFLTHSIVGFVVSFLVSLSNSLPIPHPFGLSA